MFITFQFTRPRGGAISSSAPCRRPKCFNSHAPVGARCMLGMEGLVRHSFNSHAPVGARSTSRKASISRSVSIHTPPWGRDEGAKEKSRMSYVSIHTPPWGRDFFGRHLAVVPDVSIHTPPWGRDRKREGKASVLVFQFTRPRGGAMARTGWRVTTSGFNSHAPVGARFANRAVVRIPVVSIHTPPWGRDS